MSDIKLFKTTKSTVEEIESKSAAVEKSQDTDDVERIFRIIKQQEEY